MDPMSIDPLRLLAGVVDVMTALAASLLVVVLIARLRMSSGMFNAQRLEEKRRLFGHRYGTAGPLSPQSPKLSAPSKVVRTEM